MKRTCDILENTRMFGRTFEKQPTRFNLTDLLAGKSSLLLAEFVEQLEKNGWAFLEFSKGFQEKSRNLSEELKKNVFNLSPEKKIDFKVNEHLGWHQVMGISEGEAKKDNLPFKEKLTYVTGDSEYSKYKKLPSGLKKFMEETDGLTKQLCSLLAGPLFKCDSPSQLNTHIPLLDTKDKV